MNLDKRLLQLLKFTRLPLGITIGSALLSGLSTIVQAWALAKIINRVFLQKADLSAISALFLLFVLISLFKAGMSSLSHTEGQRTAGILKQKLRAMLSLKIARLGPLYTAAEKSGELSNTIHVGVETLNAYFSQYIPQLFISAVIPVTILMVVFPFDMLSGFVFLLTAPIIPIFMILIGQTAQSMTQKQWKSLSRMSGHFLDVLQGITTLKIFGRSKQEADNVFKASEQFRRTTMKVLKIAFLSALVLEMAATISTAVIAVEIGLRLMYAKMSFEPALFILILAPEFYQPMRQLGARFHAGMEGVAAAQRIFEILNIPESKNPKPGKTNSEYRKGKNGILIEFDNVCYRYPDAAVPALSHIHLQIRPDRVTALVGKSGAGKSTLANILLRFADSYSGSVYIEKQELQSIPKNNWRAEVSWMPQKPYLFHRSVAENILIARPRASFDEMKKAAQSAGLHDFVERLPKGYQTQIGEQGARFSGGQAQRLALARAFLKDAPLLILDEPASSLDPYLDAELQHAISELSLNRSVLLIAHRLNSVQKADQIIVLDHGKIIEQGRPGELVHQNGFYADLLNAYEGGKR